MRKENTDSLVVCGDARTTDVPLFQLPNNSQTSTLRKFSVSATLSAGATIKITLSSNKQFHTFWKKTRPEMNRGFSRGLRTSSFALLLCPPLPRPLHSPSAPLRHIIPSCWRRRRGDGGEGAWRARTYTFREENILSPDCVGAITHRAVLLCACHISDKWSHCGQRCTVDVAVLHNY